MRHFDARSPASDLGAMSLKDAEGAAVSLTTGEFRPLKALVTHASRVLARDQLLELPTTATHPRSTAALTSTLRRNLHDDPATRA